MANKAELVTNVATATGLTKKKTLHQLWMQYLNQSKLV